MDYLTVGLILKGRREELGLSQRQIAEQLGYKNPNFISMLEKGRSSIPLHKIPEFTLAYDIDPVFGCQILKANYEDIWKMAVNILKPLASELFQGEDELNARIDKVSNNLKLKYKC